MADIYLDRLCDLMIEEVKSLLLLEKKEKKANSCVFVRSIFFSLLLASDWLIRCP